MARVSATRSRACTPGLACTRARSLVSLLSGLLRSHPPRRQECGRSIQLCAALRGVCHELVVLSAERARANGTQDRATFSRVCSALFRSRDSISPGPRVIRCVCRFILYVAVAPTRPINRWITRPFCSKSFFANLEWVLSVPSNRKSVAKFLPVARLPVGGGMIKGLGMPETPYAGKFTRTVSPSRVSRRIRSV